MRRKRQMISTAVLAIVQISATGCSEIRIRRAEDIVVAAESVVGAGRGVVNAVRAITQVVRRAQRPVVEPYEDAEPGDEFYGEDAEPYRELSVDYYDPAAMGESY